MKADQDADFGDSYWRSARTRSEALDGLTSESVDAATFQLMAENLPTLCWVANGDGYIVWYNRRWHDYCGTTPEQMEGWGWTAVHDPEVLPSVMERWTGAIAAGEPFEMTFPLRGADGRFRPFLTRIQPVRTADGQVVRWFGVNTDISKQVEADEALREERDRSREVLERIGDGYVFLDREFRVREINAEGMRLEQRPREAILGRIHWEAWPGSENTELGKLYKRAFAENVPVRLEHRYVWPDGRDAWIEMRAYPTGHGLAVFYRDVSERRRAEDRLRYLNIDLERQVIERSRSGAYLAGHPRPSGRAQRRGLLRVFEPGLGDGPRLERSRGRRHRFPRLRSSGRPRRY